MEKIRKKIYFVTESNVDDDTIQSDKFNQIVNPDTEQVIFDDVFQITECRDFEKYRNKKEFLATILEMALSYYKSFGENVGDIILTAIDEKTNVFLWGVTIKTLDDGTFQYTTTDWKAFGYVFKFQESD